MQFFAKTAKIANIVKSVKNWKVREGKPVGKEVERKEPELRFLRKLLPRAR